MDTRRVLRGCSEIESPIIFHIRVGFQRGTQLAPNRIPNEVILRDPELKHTIYRGTTRLPPVVYYSRGADTIGRSRVKAGGYGVMILLPHK